MDAGKAFGPGAADEFVEDGFGLVVEGVGGGDGVNGAGAEQLGEPGIAEGAGCFFKAHAVSAGVVGGVGVPQIEGEAEGVGEGLYEGGVEVGIGGADAVVHVGYAEDETGGWADGVQGPQQSDRVDAAGDGYGYAHAGVQRLEPERRR